MLICKVFILIDCLSLIVAYPNFKDKIPNGGRIPDPCSPGQYWTGVGHENKQGRGERNPFGLDFEKYGKTWTEALCRLDSDGDGRTNGEELGDPQCTWKMGQIAAHTARSHPGICEPNPEKSISQTYCDSRNSWLKCQQYTCPALARQGVQLLNMTFPETPIPGEKDSYYCRGYNLPTDSNYHIIGLRPHIDNNDYVHDIVVYGCEERQEMDDYSKLQRCFAGLEHCRAPIGAWSSHTPGGQCFSDEYGLPMGQHGYKYVVVQIHWHNFDMATGKRDSSGMVLYYTRDLRPNAGQVLRVGQRYINLPHGRTSVEVEGTCPGSCTDLMSNRTVKIASAFIRMNKLGLSGDLRVTGSSKASLIYDKHYSHNQPHLVSFQEPVPFHAGEEIKMTCRYNTEGQIMPILYGEDQDREMCAGFITIYPATPNMTICSQWKDLTVCSVHSELSYRNCDWTTFKRLMPLIDGNCDESCDGLCAVMIRGFTHSGCYRGTLAEFIQEFYINSPANKRIKNHVLPLINKCLQKVSSAHRVLPISSVAYSTGPLLLLILQVLGTTGLSRG